MTRSLEQLWHDPVDENSAKGNAQEERPPSGENGRKNEYEPTTSLPHLFDERNLDENLKRTASPAPNFSTTQADAASPSSFNEDVPSNYASPSGYSRAFSVPSVGVQKARNAAPGTPSRSASTDEYARERSARQSTYDIFGSRGVMFENEPTRSGGLSSAGLLDDVRVRTAALRPTQALSGASPLVGVSALGAPLSSAGLAGSIGAGPLASSIATTLAYSGNSRVQPPPGIGLGVTRWLYKDNAGLTQGPFSAYDMQEWHQNGFLELSLMLKRLEDPNFEPFSKLVARYGIDEPFVNELEDKERMMRFMLAQQARGTEYGALFAGEYGTSQPQQQQWPQWNAADASSMLDTTRITSGAAEIVGATIGSYTSPSYGNAYGSPYANVPNTAAGRYATTNASLFESAYSGSVGGYSAHSGVRDWGMHNSKQVVADVLSAGSAPALSYVGMDPAVSLVPQGVTSPVSPIATKYHGEPEATSPPQDDVSDKIEEEEGVFGEMEHSPAEPAPFPLKHQERGDARLDDRVQEDLVNGGASGESAAASESTTSKKKSKSKKKDRGVSVVVSTESKCEPSAHSARADSLKDEGSVRASPVHQAVAPWAAAASDNASGKLSLKEIQQLEEKERQEREKENAKRAAAALAAQVAVLKLQEANASATTSHSVWGSPAPSAAKEIKETPAGESKTLAEIMAEEEERKKREVNTKNAAVGVAVREETVAALSGVKRFADAANVMPPKTGWGAVAKATVAPIATKPVVAKPAALPAPANPSTAWNVVGKAGQSRPAVAPSVAAGRAGPPSAGVLAAPRPAVIPSASTAAVVVAQPVEPFLKWCRSALKPVERGLSINVDDFIGILMSIPRSETSTLLSVCDDTLGGLTAIDPRKFGEEFIRRRASGGGSADRGAVSPDNSAGGAERSVPGVVKGVLGAALDDFDTGNRFVTVGGKGKKKKQKNTAGK
ncbi:hypothetical protein BJ742DRAFT_802469 [Cladochytrium replicatum]|nr:hypothetical protein BJ742DRAFT_802469 [Cladochytrium replicatum]